MRHAGKVCVANPAADATDAMLLRCTPSPAIEWGAQLERGTPPQKAAAVVVGGGGRVCVCAKRLLPG
jgi:hypothetical protein